MLGKQIWRLANNQSSLFHKFFKEKFFPNGSIFYAKEGNDSFAWKSIIKGRDVISKGLQWRVGKGALIRTIMKAGSLIHTIKEWCRRENFSVVMLR